uniref:uncharacterized protein LOC127066205 n=1 Tax=Vespula vulgaris TaxID=7454 RepID=UPI00223BC2B1|nr:uncharacterized protein LOC127066205 [Vespula vulgaris]
MIRHNLKSNQRKMIIVPLLIENSILQSILTEEEMELVNNIVFFTDRTYTENQSRLSNSRISQSLYESSMNALEENTIEENITDTMVFKMLKILYSYPIIRKAAASYQMNASAQKKK